MAKVVFHKWYKGSFFLSENNYVNSVGGLWKEVLEVEMVMMCVLKRTVGRGDWFRFLVDMWIGDSTLCLSFPDFFRVATLPSTRCSPSNLINLLSLLESYGVSLLTSNSDSFH